jgi:outer membrane biosynthesis protein TonB
MRRCTRAAAVVVAGLVVAAGCRHEEGGVTAVASPSVGGGPPGVTPPTGGTEAGAETTGTPQNDASPPTADAPPAVTPPDMSAAPAYPASALYQTFSSATSRKKLIACYLPGKERDPKLRGKVIVKFTVNGDGSAKPVANEGSNLTDDDVIACVVRTIKTFHFPKPVEGSVTVVYPLIFRPTGDETLILPDAGKK